MPTLIAYVLTLVLIPVVGGVMFVLTTPLMTTMTGQSAKLYCFISHALANAARCAAAWVIFQGLDLPFGIGPMILVGVVMGAFNLAQAKESLNAYAQRLNELGLHTGSDPATLNIARMSDDQFRTLHGEVGDAFAGLIGGVVGVAGVIVVWLSMSGAA